MNKWQKKPITKKISEIKFALLNPEKVKRLCCKSMYTRIIDIDGYPVDGGLMDLRLGAIDPGVKCRTCGGRLKECLGHPGSIDLARPVMHLKYMPVIEKALRCFCHKCGNYY
jgi:DNA-directed RNA polymerase subunit A'